MWFRKLLWGLRVALVRLRFVAIMAAVALGVAYFDDIRARVERLVRPERAPDFVGEAEHEYYCPMHPAVVRAEPGKCPQCGMPLARRKKGAKEPLPDGVLARVLLSPDRVRMAGVATVEVARRPLEKRIETVGFIEVDERRLARLSARIAGRAEKLYVDFTGMKVKAGDPVYDIYSPALLNTQRELLLELEAIERAARAAPQPAAAPRSSPALEAARQRLLLWGIRPKQIEDLEKRREPSATMTIYSPISGTVIEKTIALGSYVEEGANPYTVADLSVVWMVAKVYEDDAPLVRLGQAVEIASVAFPGRTFEGHVSFIAPSLDRDTRTVSVRVDVPNPLELLRPGMYVTATLRAPIGPDGRPAAPAVDVVYRCCAACPEIESKEPGPCPKCGMPLTPHEVPREGAAGGGAWVCACAMHADSIYRAAAPGTCALCGAPLAREVTPAEGANAPRDEKASPPPTRTVYWCPMHPEVTQDAPGTCEKCGGMILEPKEVPAAPAAGPASAPLAIPAAAVIHTGARTVVYRGSAEGVFDAVEVVLGPRAGEWFPVIAGLAVGDRIVARGAFLVDAEARLNPGAAGAYFGASGGAHAGHGGDRR